MCLDRAGLVGEDGATHQGAFDLSYLRSIPNLIVAAPTDEAELRNMMYTALGSGQPFVIRYPRGCGEGVKWNGEPETYAIGRGRIIREGSDLAVITVGTTAHDAARAIERAAAEGISVEHADLRFVRPLDEELLHRMGRKFSRVITVEDGVISGGAGSAVVEFFADHGYKADVKRLGIGDLFVEQATVAQQKALCGYDAEAIYKAIKSGVGESGD
jgi:1-deoxy-D-xylulose-5-phosphate synthase